MPGLENAPEIPAWADIINMLEDALDEFESDLNDDDEDQLFDAFTFLFDSGEGILHDQGWLNEAQMNMGRDGEDSRDHDDFRDDVEELMDEMNTPDDGGFPSVDELLDFDNLDEITLGTLTDYFTGTSNAFTLAMALVSILIQVRN